MIMGGVNMKLMQGIDETESQLQKEKQTPKTEEAVKIGQSLKTELFSLFICPFSLCFLLFSWYDIKYQLFE